MKSNRRNFFKQSSLAGIGLVGDNILPKIISVNEKKLFPNLIIF